MKILIYRTKDIWIAQSIEQDITSKGLEPQFALSNWRKSKLFEDYFCWKNYHKYENSSRFTKHFIESFDKAEEYNFNIQDIFVVFDQKEFYYPSKDLEVRIAWKDYLFCN